MKTVLDKISKLYTDSLTEHGVQAKGVGWGTNEKHRLRCDKLLAVIKDDAKAISVNDLGCGYGELLIVLKEYGYDINNYYGHEISEEMLQAAKSTIGLDDSVQLSAAPTLNHIADYSFATGIFNVKFDASEEEWQEYVLDVLKNINEHSMIGFSFNILSAFVDWKEDHLYYADPAYYLKYCLENFSKKVILYHDTQLYEWTMIVFKEG